MIWLDERTVMTIDQDKLLSTAEIDSSRARWLSTKVIHHFNEMPSKIVKMLESVILITDIGSIWEFK